VFQFEPAGGVEATVDGKAVSGVTELSTKSGSGRVRVGYYSFVVRAVADDFYLLVQDSQNPAIASFKGTRWFPINPAYRLPARFTAYAQPEQVPTPLTHVDSKELFTSTGDVTFKLAGKTIRLNFNKAFNPYCSVNAYVVCPIPSSENRLDIKIAAGEKYYGHD
jgi:uncharacterized protein